MYILLKYIFIKFNIFLFNTKLNNLQIPQPSCTRSLYTPNTSAIQNFNALLMQLKDIILELENSMTRPWSVQFNSQPNNMVSDITR